MGTFDAIGIVTGGGATLALIKRPAGPLETGLFSPTGGPWVPEPEAQAVNVNGFGIDHVTGQPYFQAASADIGDEATLWIEPDTVAVWLLSD